jgi:hypothetical protein
VAALVMAPAVEATPVPVVPAVEAAPVPAAAAAPCVPLMIMMRSYKA